jgi:hypothetical protein
VANSVNTTRAWVILSAALLVAGGLQRDAFAQGQAAQNAAGAAAVTIIQQNKTRQELRETRRELTEVREALGVGKAPSQTTQFDGSEIRAVAIFLIAMAGIFVAYCFLKMECTAREKVAILLMAVWALTKAFVWLLLMIIPAMVFSKQKFVRPGDNLYELTAVAVFLLTAGVFLLPWLLRGYPSRAATLPSVANATHWLRLPGGEIRGPCHKRDVEAAASKGVYPVGTLWATSKDGPWEPVGSSSTAAASQPATADSLTTQLDWDSAVTEKTYWLRRTVGNKASGPYTTDQIRRAIRDGKLPQGCEMSESASGPWVGIDISLV